MNDPDPDTTIANGILAKIGTLGHTAPSQLESLVREACHELGNLEAALRGVHGVEFPDGYFVNVAALQEDLREAKANKCYAHASGVCVARSILEKRDAGMGDV